MSRGGKMAGIEVSKDEVIAALGRPSAEWERSSRRKEFRDRLAGRQSDLDIAGIRGYAGRTGYLGYLERSLEKPSGIGTGLVSEAEDAAIIAELKPEIKAEIERYRARLAELEKTPEAVAAFVDRMEGWLKYLVSMDPGEPTDEECEELRLLAQQVKDEHERSIAILKSEIEAYTQRLAGIRLS